MLTSVINYLKKRNGWGRYLIQKKARILQYDESNTDNLENDEAEECQEHEDEKIINEDEETGWSMIPLPVGFGHGFVQLFDLHHCRERRVSMRSSATRGNCNGYTYGPQRKSKTTNSTNTLYCNFYNLFYLFIGDYLHHTFFFRNRV